MSLSTEELTAAISELLVERLEVEPEKVTPDAPFDSMDLDSLVLVQLAVLLEKRFGVSVEDWEIANVKTISGTAELLREKAGV